MALLIAGLAAAACFLLLMPPAASSHGAPAAPPRRFPAAQAQRRGDAPGWLARRLAGLMASGRVARDLAVSGWDETLEELASRKLRLAGLALSAALLLALLGQGVGGAVALAAAVWAFQAPDLEVRRAAAARRAAIQRDLPYFLFTLAVLAESGLQLLPALDHYARNSRTALGRAVEAALAEIRLGQPPALAFLDMAQRLDVRDLTRFVGALVQTMEKGTDGLAATLRQQAETAWDKRRRLAQELGARASVKLLLPLVLFVLPAVLAMAAGPAIYAFLTQLGP
ncbi:tight adherence protein C [Symbiobacterium terraclitae]|uniref:Tight adherence protein C n=1 Tax=Symbiobacterium terraclitae TaxID=557451 RepID=A0ABS4JUE7_9FIRM|nr:type II secretion system F family protein [Symbiobacterium terraclitae]MBP2019177.1 tight adherence protein C [Symbiobacterium terraclitae]